MTKEKVHTQKLQKSFEDWGTWEMKDSFTKINMCHGIFNRIQNLQSEQTGSAESTSAVR